MSAGVLCGLSYRPAPVVKGDARPRMLLYLLVGALLLSTVLNFYFLLRLDARQVDQELESQLQDHAQQLPAVSLQMQPAPETAEATPVPDSICSDGR